uniref:NADH dehydrogenase [ubiquinone] 1 subunit C2 n=1 Tax=Equus asinus TaxID=9793 RepID=A0A8C4MBI3_EQUAS
MMSGRPGRAPLRFLPDEARSLPPPKLTDPRLVYVGFLGYCSGLIDNAIRRRPVVAAGLHRQLLYVTSFVFIGYYLLKRQDYMYALRDRDMFSYVKSHPEDFPEKGSRTHVPSACPDLLFFCVLLQ